MTFREEWLALEPGQTFVYKEKDVHFRAMVVERKSDEYTSVKVLESQGARVSGMVDVSWPDGIDESFSISIEQSPLEVLEEIRKKIERDLA